MSAPVISPITSIVAYGVGVYFDFQPAASNTPTSWVITGLPPGMTADAASGLMSGAPEQTGIYDVTIVARNVGGDSVPLVVPMVIGVGFGLQEPVILLDYDLETAAVSSPSVAAKEGEPVLFGKTGDQILIALGFVRDGQLVPQTIETVKFALKEFEPDQLLDLSTGAFRIAWTDAGPRYIFLADLSPSAAPSLLSVESGYEDDADTRADLVAQIRVNFLAVVLSGQEPSSLPRTSRNFKFRVSRNLE